MNIGGEEKVEFKLTYQEVLTRTNDYYKHVINIRPGQVSHNCGCVMSCVCVRQERGYGKKSVEALAVDSVTTN